MATTSPKSKSPEGDSPKSSKSDQRPEGLSSAIIEVAPAGEAEEGDDFETASFDVASTASTSVQSSVYQHSYENGRRYHQYRHGRYPIPNDDDEQNREDMKHALTLELTDGKLFFAPIGDNPQKIIDLGTGTGIWAIDVADQFPSADVLGLDLSPIQPSWIPPNLRFMVDDVEDEWMSGDDFDLVHLRHMSPILKDVRKLVGTAIQHTKPGGWIEIQEFGGYVLSDDDSLSGATLPALFDAASEAMGKFGMKFRIGNDVGELLEEAGWTNVRKRVIKTPIGTWPKDKTMRLCGMYMQTILSILIGALAAKPLRMLGWSNAEVEVFAAKARNDLKDNNRHAYINYLFWSAQKPEDGPE